MRPALSSLALGTFFAVLGFAYSLASVPNYGDASGLGSRAISTNATRPETIFVTESDLGTIVVGSLFTRPVNVVFGLKPHLFQFTGAAPEGISISDSGTIQGKAATPGTIGMEVRVFDRQISPRSKSKTKTFTLNAIPAQTLPTQLSIVNTSPLPTGVTNEPYSYTFHANGGILPYEYFLPDDEFAKIPKGLVFNAEGLLFGKPIQPTDGATFTIGVIDGGGTVVLKTFTVKILAGTVSSEFIGTKGTLTLDFGKDGATDSGKLSIIINKTDLYNAGIRQASDLENIYFAMNLGGTQVPPSKFILYGPDGTPVEDSQTTDEMSDELYTFDKNGVILFPNLRRGVLRKQGETTTYEIKLNPKTGLLTVKFKDFELIKGLGANFRTFNIDPVIPVNIQIGASAKDRVRILNKEDENEETTNENGDPVTPTEEEDDPVAKANKDIKIDRTDNIRFAFKRSTQNNKGVASENLKRPPGGLFLATKISGDIRKNAVAPNKDSLFMKFSGFLSDVDGAPIPITAEDRVQVFASEVTLAEFPASMLDFNGQLITFTNFDPAIGLRRLVIDRAKGTFELETNAMDPRAIFGVDFIEAGEPQTLPLTITIFNPNTANPKFDGQTNVTVFRRGNKLRNK